jgi:hypothetical protein
MENVIGCRITKPWTNAMEKESFESRKKVLKIMNTFQSVPIKNNNILTHVVELIDYLGKDEFLKFQINGNLYEITRADFSNPKKLKILQYTLSKNCSLYKTVRIIEISFK